MLPSPPASHSLRPHLATRFQVRLRLVPAQPAQVLPALVRVSAVAGLALLALAGCAKMNAALGQRWVDVSFKPGTSVTQVLSIRAACSHVPNVTPDPIARNLPALDIVHSVRFNTTSASNANMAKLTTCLGKFPAAVGVTPQDASDNGG